MPGWPNVVADGLSNLLLCTVCFGSAVRTFQISRGAAAGFLLQALVPLLEMAALIPTFPLGLGLEPPKSPLLLEESAWVSTVVGLPLLAFGFHWLNGDCSTANTLLGGALLLAGGWNYFTEEGQAMISLWDTAGEERFLSLSSCYFRNADAVLLVYSLQALVSFDSLSHWVYVARQYCADADIFLLGNKSDLENRVSEDKAEKFAVEHCASERFKVSAKTGENVERSLQEMVERLFLKKEFQRSSLQVPLQDVGYYSHCGC